MSAVLDAPPPAPAARLTPDDLLAMPDQGAGYELVGGELVETPVSALAHLTAGEVYFHLRGHVGPRRLGWTFPENSGFRCFPDDPGRVRRADAAFTRLDRYTPAQATAEGFVTVCPDLVVEVVSPPDVAVEVVAKRAEWLAAGARLVWVVFPEAREVHAYPAGGGSRYFGPTDTLDGAPVLPEFRVPVADLFALPG
jgi:Uma2 family endonuclease